MAKHYDDQAITRSGGKAVKDFFLLFLYYI
jgi:hypothetical protein